MKVLHSTLVSPTICLLLVPFLERNDLGTEVHWKPMWFIQTLRGEVVCLLQTHRKKLTTPKQVRCPNPGDVNGQFTLNVPRHFPNSPDGTSLPLPAQKKCPPSLPGASCPSLLQTDPGAHACRQLHVNQLQSKACEVLCPTQSSAPARIRPPAYACPAPGEMEIPQPGSSPSPTYPKWPKTPQQLYSKPSGVSSPTNSYQRESLPQTSPT